MLSLSTAFALALPLSNAMAEDENDGSFVNEVTVAAADGRCSDSELDEKFDGSAEDETG